MLPNPPQAGPFEMVTALKKIFLQHLDSISNRKFAIVGDTLMLRAAVDYKIVRKFGSDDDWDEKQSLNERIIANLEKEHGANPFCDKLRENLKDFPERKVVWLKSMQSWRVIRNTSLSDEMLEAWEESQSVEFPSDEQS